VSYDLYLTSPRLTQDAFNQYFSGRVNYEQPGWYANGDTGVYFHFAFNQANPENEPFSGERVAFNLNFVRPHTFGLEAEPEVSAFVEAFDCTIHDPQTDGMGKGPYSAAGFLRGWNKGNAVGYGAIGAMGQLNDILVADEAQIECTWRWNFRKSARQDEIGDSHYLPRASWGKRFSDGATVVFAVWGEGLRVAVPTCVTHVLLMRKRKVGGGLLSREKKEVVELRLISLEDVAALEGCGWREIGGERVLLAPLEPKSSRQVASLFNCRFEDPKSILQQYSPDHVLGASLMAEVMKSKDT